MSDNTERSTPDMEEVIENIKNEVLHNYDMKDEFEPVDTLSINCSPLADEEEYIMKEEVKIENVEIFEQHVDENEIFKKEELILKNDSNDLPQQIESYMEEAVITPEQHVGSFINGVHRCPSCDYSTSNKNILRIHIDSVHSILKRHKCPICDFATNYKPNLRLHIDSKHLKLKEQKCHLCDFFTSHKYVLKSHITSIHLNLKDQKCHMCDFATSRKATLKNHIDSVHINLRKFKCDMCDFASNYNSSLKSHIKSIHLKEQK